MKKKILLATKNQTDATSFLRAYGAFSHESISDLVELVFPPQGYEWVEDWTNFLGVSVVYLHRPTSHLDVYVIQAAQKHGIPVWIDHDDDYESITPDNPQYDLYKDCKENVQFSFEQADILTVSGLTLYERLKNKYEKKLIHITTALDDRLMRFKRPYNNTRTKKIAWRGSKSHQSDLLYFHEEIVTLMKTHRSWEWFFFGIHPYWIEFADLSLRYKSLPPRNLFDYYAALTATNSNIHWVPLIDTTFNRVKSNLGWIDATLAGSAVLGPDLPEYRRPGVALYNPMVKKDFLREFQNMLERSDATLSEMHRNSWEWIKDNILLSKLNLIRREILNNL